MDDANGFLRAIAERPDDDLPRLIFADYLDERGDDARAEFIRVGCERARAPAGSPHYRRLVERELTLLADHQREWEDDWRPASVVRFDRGFASVVEMEAASFAKHAVRMLGCGPAPCVSLRNAWESIDELVKLPADLPLGELDLSNNSLTNPELDDLLAALWWPNVRTLNLARNRLTAPAASRIAYATRLSGLTRLVLDSNDLACSGALALAAGPAMKNLSDLSLADTDLRTNGAIGLVQSTTLVNLEVLNLRRNPLGSGAIRALATGPAVGRWRRLVLQHGDLTSEQTERLREALGDVLCLQS